MLVPVSTNMYPDVFSPAPHYSIELPPEVSDTSGIPALEPLPSNLGANPRVLLTLPYDPYVVTAETSDTTISSATAALTALWCIHADRNECTQSVFLEHDHGSNSSRYVPLPAMLSNNLPHWVVTAVRNELAHSRRSRPSLNVWLAFSATSDFARLNQNIDKISFDDAALEYFTILADCLKPKSFSTSDEYEDPLGGKVTDYFRGDERITCIVSVPHVQVLSFLQGSFQERVFDRKAANKPTLVEYLEGLVSDEEAHDLDTSKDG